MAKKRAFPMGVAPPVATGTNTKESTRHTCPWRISGLEKDSIQEAYPLENRSRK